ncbi:hypothetical protein EDB81DRAFT_890817 [Dactylonectria macrodidyma]|uniref:Glycosyl hydrolase family 95 N-terminal domain-containing protein n=1 Tax=Dactylonectria macrodidyma TaxID=307937 RepID=A0A9P9DLX6_9HYPO|nr:hypothetical protein EDB81DRAFT_890817 [Dactylonectria macrodidyma]
MSDCESTGANQGFLLHDNSPASPWSEAPPIGNARLGATIHGRTPTELIQLQSHGSRLTIPAAAQEQMAKMLGPDSIAIQSRSSHLPFLSTV